MRSNDMRYYEQRHTQLMCKHCGCYGNRTDMVMHDPDCPLAYMKYLERCIDDWAYEIQKTRLQRAVLKSVLRKIFALLEEHLPKWYLRGHYLMILNALGKKDGYHVED